jgi:hypothetical protein
VLRGGDLDESSRDETHELAPVLFEGCVDLAFRLRERRHELGHVGIVNL